MLSSWSSSSTSWWGNVYLSTGVVDNLLTAVQITLEAATQNLHKDYHYDQDNDDNDDYDDDYNDDDDDDDDDDVDDDRFQGNKRHFSALFE